MVERSEPQDGRNRKRLLKSFCLLAGLIAFYHYASAKWDRDSQKLLSQISQPPALGFLDKRTIPQRDTEKFSAFDLMADLDTAEENNEDFLTLYLHSHFQHEIQDRDIRLLQQKLAESEARNSSLQTEFRLGIFHFFLALAQTKQLVANTPIDPQQISNHWDASVHHFVQAGEIGRAIAKELKKILAEADTNQNLNLERKELIFILESRTAS